MKIKHCTVFERERERENARNKMSVDYLFIERAHIGTHGHMLACTAHRFVHTCGDTRENARSESTRTCPRFPWEWTKSSFRAAVYFALCLFVNANTAFIVCRNNTMKVAREWIGEINFRKKRFNPLKFEFKKFRKEIYRESFACTLESIRCKI